MESDEKKEEKKKGISLRVVYIWIMVLAVVIFVMTMLSVLLLTHTFKNLSGIASENTELEKASHKLMDASDYLTEKVQRFTLYGNPIFMNDYFTEAFETKNREKAIETMSKNEKYSASLKQLQKAMDESIKLMDQEYYAMKLVIEAKGITDYPELLDSISLIGGDEDLSPDEKMFKATSMVLGDEYYTQKDKIRENMRKSLDELVKISNDEENRAMYDMMTELIIVGIMSIIQTAAILFMIVLTSHLGIKPVLAAVEKIKDEDPIPEIGANEFRYLAHTYNKMYSIYRGSLERLNFKASHDELTGAYNRSGYELLLSSIDMNTTHMILFDLDNFKNINDSFGHKTGDEILRKLVNTLKRNFRNDDYICRIGGDEFVVFMVHSNEMQRELIRRKIEQINKQLLDVNDGLPPISVSVGIVHGTDVPADSNVFEKADEAMYKAKQSGKSTLSFYSE